MMPRPEEHSRSMDWITGCDMVEEKHLLVLVGILSLLPAPSFLCYDYAGTDFYGNKRRLTWLLPFTR